MQLTMWGYADGLDADRPMKMREVTLVTTPEALRRISAFLIDAAETMERAGDSFGHAHLRDEVDSVLAADIIVSAP